MNTNFYSERGTRTYTLTLGDTTAFSEAFDFSAFAGAVLVVPSGATGNLELQIQVGGSWYYALKSDGSRYNIDLSSVAGNAITLPADMFPLSTVRLALTDGAGTAQAGATSYTMYLVAKT